MSLRFEQMLDMHEKKERMVLLTIDHIPGVFYEIIGSVQGSSLFKAPRDEASDIVIISRARSVDMMIKDAAAKGADAIIDVHFSVNYISRDMSEVFCNGTAVKYMSAELT